MSTQSRNSHRLLPSTAQGIVENILRSKFTIDEIADNVGVSHHTIKRIQRGTKPSRKTEIGLIRLYCKLIAHNPCSPLVA